jgi:hypothetical protein
MIFFHNTSRFNYAKESILLLYKYQYQLSPKQAEQMIYKRFINTKGTPGTNISADLHMEHLNLVLKDGISSLEPNKTEKSIIQLGKTVGLLEPILRRFDEVNGIEDHNTKHKQPNLVKDVTT